jgi:hypothetical protein
MVNKSFHQFKTPSKITHISVIILSILTGSLKKVTQYTAILKMEAVYSSETLDSTWYRNPEDKNLDIHYRESLKFIPSNLT